MPWRVHHIVIIRNHSSRGDGDPNGLDLLELDSGVSRTQARHFHVRSGMTISAFRFSKWLTCPSPEPRLDGG